MINTFFFIGITNKLINYISGTLILNALISVEVYAFVKITMEDV